RGTDKGVVAAGGGREKPGSSPASRTTTGCAPDAQLTGQSGSQDRIVAACDRGLIFHPSQERGVRPSGVLTWPPAALTRSEQAKGGCVGTAAVIGSHRRDVHARSEERRVGKECRARWATDQKKKRKQGSTETSS